RTASGQSGSDHSVHSDREAAHRPRLQDRGPDPAVRDLEPRRGPRARPYLPEYE
ncbi:hypothetical protein Pmar_PMAR018549, partial [Perkinsus marinus ATCC 50983]